MGTGYNLLCPSCGYGAKIYIGIGLRFDSLDSLNDRIPADTLREIMNIKSSCHNMTEVFYNSLFYCRVCREYQTRLHTEIRYQDQNGEHRYTAKHYCRHNHRKTRARELRLTTGSKENPYMPDYAVPAILPCPKCHRKMATIGNFLWD